MMRAVRTTTLVGLMAVLAALVQSGSVRSQGEEAKPQSKPAEAKAEAKPAEDKSLSPAEALAKFTVPEDLALEQVLAEPVVRQPLFFDFDERGRLWVVQYLQYPYPAGLKMLSKDKFWRAVYDKVPPAPPNHFVGADKITIHEDTNGDGVYDKHKTFIEGLNIVTSCARGRGGVWVLNPPYLLFYPDRDNDDVPDGDPEVHLSGFGLADTHSVVNSLRWGPDGWLYACQGSTVGGDVKRPGDKMGVHSMGQLIWRYHPETRRYEIFAEGGGNAFGCEIDAKGRVYSGHNGGDTRGFHYVQGGYFQKGFSKHGELSNPYAFGYFLPMAHEKVPRFTHNFVIYEGAALPEHYAGKLFGVGPLQSHIVYAEMLPDRSSFQTKDLGHPVTSEDKRFRPVEIKAGPDGGIYIADMYEPQIAHRQHFDGQIDKTTGRVYRLKAKGAEPLKPFDLGKLTTRELIDQLKQKNKWFRQTALRLVGDRRDASAVPLLTELVEANTGQFALEALWALNLSGGFNEDVAQRTLNHDDPYVRLWTVRLLGDDNQVSPSMAASLAQLAWIEKDVMVRSQLASTSKRLPAEAGLPIVRNLLARDEDASDIHVPLLLWWAIEAKAEADREAVLALFEDSAVWRLPLVNEHILERLMRRYARAGTRKDLLTCARLFELSPGEPQTKRLMAGFEQAFQGRSLANLPDELVKALAKQGGLSLVLDVRQGRPEAVEKALAIVADEKADKLQRLQFVEIFGEVKEPRSIAVLLGVVRGSGDNQLRQAALAALAQYDDPGIGKSVVEGYGELPNDVRSVAQTLLASRSHWTRMLLEAIQAKKIDPATVPLDVVWKIQLHRDEEIAESARKIWGDARGATPAELQEKIERLAVAIREDVGDPYNGKKLFRATCAKCHIFFNDGGKIGPDLTSYKRDDLASMLLAIVNPSAEIREGFETYLAITIDGRTVTGFLVDRDTQVVVLRGPDGQNVSIPQDRIDEMLPQRKSLMPEELLKSLSDQEVRDLFAYLRSTQPLND